MDIAETQKQILHSDEFVLEEIKRLQYLYGLQRVIRNHLVRQEDISTESVAEHLYGMRVLADYFLQLEGGGVLNRARVDELITWHDVDEIETGDVIGYLKTEADRQKEAAAQVAVLEKMPHILSADVKSCLDEYHTQETAEAKFVKAIDKIEPFFHEYNENGKKIFVLHKITRGQVRSIKTQYIKEYQYINRFYEVFDQKLIEEGFYQDS